MPRARCVARARRLRNPRRARLRRHSADSACASAPPREPSATDRAVAGFMAWLKRGNPLARIGIVILFFGAAFLAKYAADNSLFPIELRFIALALGAFALLIVGWRLRERRAVYAELLQGGGIAGLYLTVFAATRLYQLLPPDARLRIAGGHCARGCGARGRAERAGTRRHRHGRRLPRADPGFDRQRQLRRAVHLLRTAESRRVRGRVVQDVARAERARLSVHVHDHRPVARQRRIKQRRPVDGRRVPDPVLPDVRRGLDPQLRAAAAEPERLCFRLAGVRPAGRRIHAARDDDLAHRVRARVERVRARCLLPAARLDPVRHAPRNLPAARRSLRRARRDLREPRDPAGVRHAHDRCDVGGRRRGTALARRASGAEIAALVRHLAAGRRGCRISDRLRRSMRTTQPILNTAYLGAAMLAVSGVFSGYWLFRNESRRAQYEAGLAVAFTFWGIIWWFVGGVQRDRPLFPGRRARLAAGLRERHCRDPDLAGHQPAVAAAAMDRVVPAGGRRRVRVRACTAARPSVRAMGRGRLARDLRHALRVAENRGAAASRRARMAARRRLLGAGVAVRLGTQLAGRRAHGRSVGEPRRGDSSPR